MDNTASINSEDDEEDHDLDMPVIKGMRLLYMMISTNIIDTVSCLKLFLFSYIISISYLSYRIPGNPILCHD